MRHGCGKGRRYRGNERIAKMKKAQRKDGEMIRGIGTTVMDRWIRDGKRTEHKWCK